MAFKQNPNKKARLEDMSKAALIKTVRTLQRRETKLLNQVAKLEKAQDKLADALAGQLRQSDFAAAAKVAEGAVTGRATVQTEGFAHSGDGGGAIQREAPETPARFPWEE